MSTTINDDQILDARDMAEEIAEARESRPRQIQAEAETATNLILAGFGRPVDEYIRDVVRRAYWLGRTEQAAYSFDKLVKTCRSQAER